MKHRQYSPVYIESWSLLLALTFIWRSDLLPIAIMRKAIEEHDDDDDDDDCLIRQLGSFKES
jgi:hypothetical protein